MEGNNNNHDIIETKVLDLLSKSEYKSTTEISGNLGRNYYDILRILEKYESLGLIEKTQVKNYTYWRLIDAKEI